MTFERRVQWDASGISEQNRDLIQATTRSLLAVTAGAVFCLWVYLAYDIASSATYTCAVLGSCLLLACIRLVDSRPTWAAATMIAGMLALLIATARMTDSSAPLVLLVLPVFASAVLFGGAASVVSGALASGGVLLAGPGQTSWHTVALPMLCAVWGWLCLCEHRRVLRWSWEQALLASALTRQLRDETGRLNRTVKDLDASYKLLQESNRQLLQARQEADILRELRHRFAINLSHELRTPLNIILGFANLIYRRPSMYGYSSWNGAVLRDLAELRRNADHLSELLDDVIDLARIDALAMPVRREPTDVASLVDAAVATVASLAQEKGLALRASHDGDLPRVLVDPLRIRQVILNLLTNAIRYTDSGSIGVGARRTESGVIVSVADTGRGIPESELQTLFSEFHQVSRPKSDPEQGKGLGLALAKRLVQLHGGSLWVESTVGAGSTFSFVLPLIEKQTSRLTQPSSRHTQGRRNPPRVVMLGDGLSSSYLSRRLEDFDFEQVTLEEAGAQLLNGTSPAAVIIDNSAADGPRSGHVLSVLPDSVPVIECPLPNMGWILKDTDFSSVLTKPILAGELIEVIERATSQAVQQCRILIVDDERGFVRLLDRMLEAHCGHRCQIASAYNGPDALARMNSLLPDVVLLDLVLGEMSGFDVLQAMRADPHLAHVPVIAVTAATPGEDSLRTEASRFEITVRGGFPPGALVSLLETSIKAFEGIQPALHRGEESPEAALAPPV